MIVYKVTNLINGKIYIGQTIHPLNDRKARHIYSSNNKNGFYFHSALRKYGTDNFSWKVIRMCDSIESLNDWEQYYIKKFNSIGEGGYNLQSGGKNFKRTAEDKEKMSKEMKRIWEKSYNTMGMVGKKHSKTAKEKQSKARKGKIVSGETRKKIGNANRGEKCYFYGNNQKDKNNNFYSKKHTIETKKKIRQSVATVFSIQTAERVRKIYKLGLTISEISERTGFKYYTIYDVLFRGQFKSF